MRPDWTHFFKQSLKLFFLAFIDDCSCTGTYTRTRQTSDNGSFGFFITYCRSGYCSDTGPN